MNNVSLESNVSLSLGSLEPSLGEGSGSRNCGICAMRLVFSMVIFLWVCWVCVCVCVCVSEIVRTHTTSRTANCFSNSIKCPTPGSYLSCSQLSYKMLTMSPSGCAFEHAAVCVCVCTYTHQCAPNQCAQCTHHVAHTRAQKCK